MDGGPGDFLGWGSPSPASPLGQRPGCRWGVQLSPEGCHWTRWSLGTCGAAGSQVRLFLPTLPCCPSPPTAPSPPLWSAPPGRPHPPPLPSLRGAVGGLPRAPWAGGRRGLEPTRSHTQAQGVTPCSGPGTGQGQGTGAGGGSTVRAPRKRPKEKWICTFAWVWGREHAVSAAASLPGWVLTHGGAGIDRVSVRAWHQAGWLAESLRHS